MKEIQLTQGKVALVDDEDYERLSVFKWTYANGYAMRHIYGNGNPVKVWMHRFINNTPDEYETDHINGNKLDNQQCNLRSCTHAENSRNRLLNKNNQTGFKGVSYGHGKWRSRIKLNGKDKHLGYFTDKDEAIEAYRCAANLYYGEFAS